MSVAIPETTPLSPARATLAALLLAALTLLFHGWCLADGSVLDDHWHQKGLREHGWSMDQLLLSTRIEPSQWTHLWWQNQSMAWEYARPVFIWTMKLLYHVIGNDDPIWLHAFSLLLHWINACLVALLLCRLTHSHWWSLFGGVLFIIYPHALISVAWPSSLNCVMHVTLMLIVLMLYRCASHNAAASTSAPLRIAPFVTCLVIWIVALFTRENALLLPVILLAFDASAAGPALIRRRWPAYLCFTLIGGSFVLWRILRITQPMPEVYTRLYAGEGIEYPLWLLAKLLHYVCTSIWLAPMSIGPTGRFNPWIEAPGDCTIMLAIVATLSLLYWRAARRHRGWWIWPLWIVLMVLPVLPVIATPHSGYASGVGFAIAVALAASCALPPSAPPRTGPWSSGQPAAKPRYAPGWSIALAWFFLCTTAGFTILNRWQWTAIIAAERYFNDAVAAAPPPDDTTDVFLLNLPFANIYAKPALDHRLPGFDRLRWHVLCFSPQILMVEDNVTVEQFDTHRLRITAGPAQPFFSRLLGRFLFEAFRDGPRFKSGDRYTTPDFDILILDADKHGVRSLEFAFPKPLNDPNYCFYLSTLDCPAMRIRFEPVGTVPESQPALAPDIEELGRAHTAITADAEPIAIDALFRGVQSPNATIASRAADLLDSVLGAATRALGAPEQFTFESDSPSRDWPGLRQWWFTQVDREVLCNLRYIQEDLSYLVKQREELPHGRVWAAKVFQLKTDLYLTGPPFPTSREEIR